MTNHIEPFSHVEYRVAAEAYHRGIDIGYTVIRNYFALNALLFAGIGLSGVSNETLVSDGSTLVMIVPFIAIGFSILLMTSFPYYRRHLSNCEQRCAEIEAMHDGRLFVGLIEVEQNRWNIFTAQRGFNMIIILLIATWVAVGIQVDSWEPLPRWWQAIVGRFQ